MRREKACPAQQQLDVVALQLVADEAFVDSHHMVQAVHHTCHTDVLIEFHVRAIGAAMLDRLHIDGTLAQRLTRDRTAMHAKSSDTAFLLDHEYASLCFRALNSGFLAGWATTDNYNVIARCLHQVIASTMWRIRSCLAKRVSTSSGYKCKSVRIGW